MKITDMISITELSRLLKKTRPTVYKYISDFEKGNYSALPRSVRKLFTEIANGSTAKKDIYEYCDHWYSDDFTATEFRTLDEQSKKTTVKDIINLIKNNEKKLNLSKIKEFIEEELKNEKNA